MKAISLTQPYATAVALSIKPEETRSWRTTYRGPLAIHASKGFPRWARDFAAEEWVIGRLPPPSNLPLGAMLCLVRLVDCVRTEDRIGHISETTFLYGDYTPGRWAWMLDLVEVFPEPIRATGALGLWEWDPSAATRTVDVR